MAPARGWARIFSHFSYEDRSRTALLAQGHDKAQSTSKPRGILWLDAERGEGTVPIELVHHSYSKCQRLGSPEDPRYNIYSHAKQPTRVVPAARPRPLASSSKIWSSREPLLMDFALLQYRLRLGCRPNLPAPLTLDFQRVWQRVAEVFSFAQSRCFIGSMPQTHQMVVPSNIVNETNRNAKLNNTLACRGNGHAGIMNVQFLAVWSNAEKYVL